jgi:hypothetical protein
MFVVLWEFDVKPGYEPAFESTYGPDGSWVALFRRDTSYLETRLLHDPFHNQIYVTADFWTSRDAYTSFQTSHHAEYRAIDASCEALTVQERKLGEFETPSSKSSIIT